MRMPHGADPHMGLVVIWSVLILIVAYLLIDLAFKHLPHLMTRLARVRTVHARVAEKRAYPLILFCVGSRVLELTASDGVWQDAAEGSEGVLTYQGEMAIRFRPLT